MINAVDHTVASIGLTRLMTLANSALPDAPVVPDTPRESLADRARHIAAATRRFITRPTPAVPEAPVMTQG